MTGNDTSGRPRRGWAAKFGDAFRGLWLGIRGQNSFAVHLLCAAAVIGAAAWFQLDAPRWCLLALCITVVLTAEMFNSALESLAKAVDPRPNPQLGAALDVASAAVLIAALGAVVVGLIVFLPPAVALFGG